MTTFKSKFIDMFRNLKSDAVPKQPRPTQEEFQQEIHEENIEVDDHNADSSSEPEEIIIEEETCENKKKKTKSKIPFFKSGKFGFPSSGNPNKQNGSTTVNAQATGNIVNIVNASNIRLGNDYYMGVDPKQNSKQEETEENIKMDKLIKILLEANVKPIHDHLECISQNISKNWRNFFRSLGFSEGRIQSAEIDAGSYGVAEARYKLLLEWVNNDDDGSLGYLATLLWQKGEKKLVKELSTIYKNKT